MTFTFYLKKLLLCREFTGKEFEQMEVLMEKSIRELGWKEEKMVGGLKILGEQEWKHR